MKETPPTVIAPQAHIGADSENASQSERREANAYDFINFVASSPSSFHAAESAAELLEAAGFIRRKETDPWQATPGGHFIVRGGALMAWFVPATASPESGFRIIGAHNDSPGFKLKHNASFTTAGWQQAAVEVYGGPILHTWFDRELVLAGKIGLNDGTTRLVTTPPILRIPTLAIHLDREANTSLSLKRQLHTQPIYAVGDERTHILEIVAASADIEFPSIISHDLITVDAQPGEIFGADSTLLASGRLDNLSSVYPGVQALISATQDSLIDNHASNDILVLALFDHEEIGSTSTTGAAGPILQDVLERTAFALGATPDDLHRMYARSSCISADAAHSIHPNYTERHDAHNYPLLGQGPVLKINANQRYASNTETESLWIRMCRNAGITSQVFVGNNDMPCGSTIGPITATRLGIPTVDVGIPLLSMHSARELASTVDLEQLMRVLHAYLIG
ncbi:aspartyl aminopeptidase [Corynebacterium kutscheri]|uniref:M18 family aminopeptidase n=1 Tax=Corynebacterium kutscheri TaxID=35755 RepID=A0A0F6R1S7_9CORY|nr:M18 family aminopeptidase [Corynebacterium kutscheri]AKE41218.1 aspartyl aminopeptidase [Corynebacterium kutscheri]VEH08494.1 Aminopeptidase 2 [Corynebacterium kutscheri]VEH09540.1 Aminopeptidase 2 [Corynebacterium kutscheri]